MIDLERIRRETPATERIAHLNNAGASLMPQTAFDVMIDYLHEEQRIGGYEAASANMQLADSFYQEAARLYHCTPEEIAFCGSDTQAWLKFFHSLPLKAGDRVITTRLNYGTHFVGFIQKAKLGVETVLVECDDHGDVDLHSLERSLDDRTRLITLSHIPTSCGTVNDAESVGRIAREADIPFVLDACQSSGQIPVDVRKIGCTALTATGRKYLRGPRGTGLLYVEQSFLQDLEPVELDQYGVELLGAGEYRLRDGAGRFENFEVSHAARAGLGTAIGYANEIGMEWIAGRIVHLGNACREMLSELRSVTVHDRGHNLGGIVTFSMTGRSPEDIEMYLQAHDVNISVSSGPGGLVDLQARNLDSVARASVHYFNTLEEIEKMTTLLARMD